MTYSYKSILLHLDSEPEAGGNRQAYAISLAASLGAHVTGIAFALDPTIPPMIMGEVPGALLEGQRKAEVDAAQAAVGAFSRAASKAGISADAHGVEATETAAPSVFARRGRTHDLTIVGQTAPDDPFAIRQMLLEAALFDSGRPVLVVPYSSHETARFDSVIVAWDGHREAARAAHDALPLLRLARRVEVVIVDDGRMKPVRGDVGSDLAEGLARHGLTITTQHVTPEDGDVAGALLTRAGHEGADLLVMGGYGHSRLREFIMGGATRGILEKMTVPVLMAH